MNISIILTYHLQPYEINRKAVVIFFLIVYLICVAIVTRMGLERVIGALKAFIISIFLTPLVGFFIVVFSQISRKPISRHRKARSSPHHRIHLFKCSNCGYKYKDNLEECPLCGRKKDFKEGDMQDNVV
jgi:hypothetical protein